MVPEPLLFFTIMFAWINQEQSNTFRIILNLQSFEVACTLFFFEMDGMLLREKEQKNRFDLGGLQFQEVK